MIKPSAMVLLATIALSTSANAALGDWLKKRAEAVTDAVTKGVDSVSEAAQKTADDVGQQVDDAAGVTDSEASVQNLRKQAARMAAECRSQTKMPDPDYDPCVKTCGAVQAYEINPNNPLAGQMAKMAFSSCQQQHAAVTGSVPQTTAGATAPSGKPSGGGQAPAEKPADLGPHMVIAAPSDRFDAIKLPEFKGLPRLGGQDSEGLEVREERNRMSSEQLTALNLRKFRIQHNLRYYRLLVGVGLADQLFDGMDPSRMLWGVLTKGMHPQPGQQEYRWATAQYLMFHLATHAIGEQYYADYFCKSGSPSCRKFQPQTGQLISPTDWGGGFTADEFDRRAAYDRFVKADYDNLRAWSGNVTREAYFIGSMGLGEYDFDRSAFTADVRPFRPLGQPWDAMLVRDLGFEHDPSRSQVQTGPMGGIRTDLPMQPHKAKALLDSFSGGGRSLYTVTRIRFLDGGTVRAPHGFVVPFAATSPTVELYKDESLTELIGSIHLGAQASN